MESIDALATAVNAFQGGLILVSHDMRLISQVAKEIWICDNRCITIFKGDIQQFKMTMRAQIMDLEQQELKGDASTLKKEVDAKVEPKNKMDKKATIEVVAPSSTAPKKPPQPAVIAPVKIEPDDDTAMPTSLSASTESGSYVPPHLRAGAPTTSNSSSGGGGGAYIPPHLRRKLAQEQQAEQHQD